MRLLDPEWRVWSLSPAIQRVLRRNSKYWFSILSFQKCLGKMGHAARERALSSLTLKRCAEEYEEVYREVIEHRTT